ncbi:hypothetical protein HG531_013785 [Fusarium graminearum]|nr:hypothetical protein HG531_013785 [Fusarium graminearum]
MLKLNVTSAVGDIGLGGKTNDVNPRLDISLCSAVSFDREDSMACDELRRTIGVKAHFVITRIGDLDDDGVSISVGYRNSLNLLGLDVGAVHGVYPHIMAVDGKDSADKVDCADDVKC